MDFSTYISEQGLEGFRHLAGFHVPQFDHKWCLMCQQEHEYQREHEEEAEGDVWT